MITKLKSKCMHRSCMSCVAIKVRQMTKTVRQTAKAVQQMAKPVRRTTKKFGKWQQQFGGSQKYFGRKWAAWRKEKKKIIGIVQTNFLSKRNTLCYIYLWISNSKFHFNIKFFILIWQQIRPLGDAYAVVINQKEMDGHGFSIFDLHPLFEHVMW